MASRNAPEQSGFEHSTEEASMTGPSHTVSVLWTFPTANTH